MDDSRFDALTRAIASRRLAIGGGAALLLGLVGDDRAAQAKCKPAGARCGRQKCCSGARCRRKRCRCKRGRSMWAGECCKHRFALASGQGLPPIAGTEFCCPSKGICSKDSDPAHDDCCQDGETCLNGKCCCDGCRGTVICGGVCCGSDSCCNGECCPAGQVCAEGTCVNDQRDCDDCYAGETCWGEKCCTPERRCLVTEGDDENVRVLLFRRRIL